MGLEHWADMFRFNKELLDDDFTMDQNLTMKVKSKSTDGKSEGQITYKQSKPNKENGTCKQAMESKLKSDLGCCKVEGVLKESGFVSGEMKEAIKQVKGLTLVGFFSATTGETNNNLEARPGVEFAHEKVKAKLNVDLTKKGLTELNAGVKAMPELFFGANVVFDPRVSRVTKYDAGYILHPAENLTVSSRHESTDAKEYNIGKIIGLMQHKADANNTLGADFTYLWKEKKLSSRFGVKHTFTSDTTGKLRIDQDGKLAAALRTKLGSSSTLIVNGQIDVKDMKATNSAPLPLGFGLEFNF